MDTNSKAVIATQYVNVVKTFLKRSDVLTARALAYHPNKEQPLVMKNWFKFGDAFVTTGFCVCVSSAILDDKIFQAFLQYRNARAKLISIDIKEQFYGYCKPSYLPNKWHTAIFLEDSGHHFIIDATCAQFGNAYVGKLVWDFKTWVETFQSATDKHIITDFDGNDIQHGVTKFKYNNVKPVIKKELETNLFDNVLLNSAEQATLSEFLLNGYNLFNAKVLTGQIQDSDLKFINYIHESLSKFKLNSSANSENAEEYAILGFDSSFALKKFVKFITDNIRVETGVLGTDMTLSTLPVYVMTSKTISEAQSYLERNASMFGFNHVSIRENDTERYLLLKFTSTIGVDMSKYIEGVSNFVSCGVDIFVDFPNCFYNLGERNHRQKNNTYVLECNVLPQL